MRNEVLPRIKEDRNILNRTKRRRLTGLVSSCVETALQNVLLEER